MKFYVYFDAYRRPLRTVNEEELLRDYNDDTEGFLSAMNRNASGAGEGRAGGHVGTFSFDTEEELKDYLEGCGEEITGFYECENGSRPYNF